MISVHFRPSGRGAAQCPTDPNYPSGIDVDASRGAVPFCVARLPYPAPECGAFLLACSDCDQQIAITVAGRPDDPRTVQIACIAKHERQVYVVICRRASEPPKPGLDRHGVCLICGAELAMSEGAEAKVAAGGKPFCNSCGGQYLDVAHALGKVSGIHFTPSGFDAIMDEVNKRRRDGEAGK